MTRTLTPPAPVSLAEFDAMFEAVKNWGRWGPDDELGTLNYLTPDKVAAAAALVKSGRTVSMAIPINKVAGPDNPNPAVHLMSLMHDLPVSASGLSFGMCFLGMASHGDCHTHVDALNHVAYRGQLYNGKPASQLTSRGSEWGSIAAYANGIVGRGVLLDAARHREVDWLEPGEAVTRAELEAIEAAEGVRAGRGRHSGLPHRPPCQAPGARCLEQRVPARRRGQGRAARRHHPVDARAADRRLPARRRRRDRPEQRRGHALSDPSAAADRHGHAASRTACSSRIWRRPARRRDASSSWSSACRSACPAPRARPGIPSPSSEAPGIRPDRSGSSAHRRSGPRTASRQPTNLAVLPG